MSATPEMANGEAGGQKQEGIVILPLFWQERSWSLFYIPAEN